MIKFNFLKIHKALHLTFKRNFAQIPISLIKDLRNQTGSSIDECKKALEACNGDLTKAKEHLKKRGLAQAEKKLGRSAQQGVIATRLTPNAKTAIIAEVNCETDFVAKNETFLKFVNIVLEKLVLRNDVHTYNFTKTDETVDAKIDKILHFPFGEKIPFEKHEIHSLYDAKQLAISKLQENIKVNRIMAFTTDNPAHGMLGIYVHNQLGRDIGSSCCVVDIETPAVTNPTYGSLLKEFSDNMAMQIMGSKPQYLTREKIPKEILDKEIANVREQLGEAFKSKPARVQDQMIEGKLRKHLEDLVLYYQQYVLEEDGQKTVEEYIKQIQNKIGQQIVINKFLTVNLGGESQNYLYILQEPAQRKICLS